MPNITILKRPRDEAVITQRRFFKKTSRGKVIKGVYPSPVCRVLNSGSHTRTLPP